ncbi:GNAT family N-acetyltransferase [Rhizobium sp. CG5]|uniref:GNAT family N-acetyltransferase n=1 Tax=Rhizobium sp. CG5 TaxID=2726076 RepID=UPI002033F7FC|nr:GNAT family N-acetyltransferase [Rhizobium sp. CG5]MCM2477291.1 GNAT family N-acetyltransferase [Rhizobium sp. CG5]
MSAITLRRASEADLLRIASMNRELIQDEGHRNPMTLVQLEDRAREFLCKGDWYIDLLETDGKVAGFATWREEDDITELSGKRIYLRQFYIARDVRGGGMGRRAFEALMSQRFPPDSRILLEVLHSNPGGQEFWAKMDFTPYSQLVERRSPATKSKS